MNDDEKWVDVADETESTTATHADEEFNEEDLALYFEEAREESNRRARERAGKKSRSPFERWMLWLLSIALVVMLLPQTLSIPAIDFLITSAKLSTDADVKQYKEAIAVIKTDDSKGTGFVMDDSGQVLTNYHVIEGYDTVTVSLPNDGFYTGEVVEAYPEIDLAVVQIEGDNLPALELASSFELINREKIYFIGNPLNFIHIANQGEVLDYISVDSKELPVVMIDAPVYRGNSGSPVIDMNGEVIGVVYATTKTERYGKVGLFIPIDYLYAARAVEAANE